MLVLGKSKICIHAILQRQTFTAQDRAQTISCISLICHDDKQEPMSITFKSCYTYHVLFSHGQLTHSFKRQKQKGFEGFYLGSGL